MSPNPFKQFKTGFAQNLLTLCHYYYFVFILTAL